LRIGCCGRYLGLRRTRQQGNGEDYVTRCLMISTLAKYHLFDQIKKNEMEGGVLAFTWERRGAYRILVGEPDGKSQLGRRRHGRKGNIKMDF